MAMKTIKIGVDLDGVIVGKPIFIPKSFIEWLVKNHHSRLLNYRFPKSRIEKWIRQKSHHWTLRPPMRKNFIVVKSLANQKNMQIFIISGRYSFLEGKTKEWFKRNGFVCTPERIFLNVNDEQPHYFKEKIIKKLDLDYFFDDDPKIIQYLKVKIKNTVFVRINKDGAKKLRLLLERSPN